MRKAADWVIYVAARTLMAMLQCLPWSAGNYAAGMLGELAYYLERKHRKEKAVANLLRVFPGIEQREARRILRKSYRHFVASLMDALYFVRFAGRGSGKSLYEAVGIEKLQGLPRGKGIIFVSGHFGHWEILGAASSLLGYPVWSIGTGFRNPYLDKHVRSLRERTGQRIIPKAGALRHVIRLVRAGKNVGFLIDQDARREGVFVDFLGMPASTTPAPARIAISTGAPIAFVYARRVPNMWRFRVVVEDVIIPQPTENPDVVAMAITQRLTRNLERLVRRTPEEWPWRHRRWRTRPLAHVLQPRGG